MGEGRGRCTECPRLLICCYRKAQKANPWPNEGGTVFTTNAIYDQFLNYSKPSMTFSAIE